MILILHHPNILTPVDAKQEAHKCNEHYGEVDAVESGKGPPHFDPIEHVWSIRQEEHLENSM